MIDPEAVEKISKNGGAIWVLDQTIGVAGLNNNGGQYDTGVTVLVAMNGSLVGGRYWNSCDFSSVCPGCGMFSDNCDCETVMDCPRPDDLPHKAFDLSSQEEIEVYWRRNDNARRSGFLPVQQ